MLAVTGLWPAAASDAAAVTDLSSDLSWEALT